MKNTSINKRHLNFGSDKELCDFLLGNLTETLRQSIRTVVKIMIKEEMENLRKEVDEKLSFNGYYQRNMLSSAGKVDIAVPRFRETPMESFPLKSMGIFSQEKDNFLRIIAEMHRLGISQRKVKQLCQTCFGVRVSKTRVGKVHRELADQEEMRINSQPLADEFEYLLVDGIWAKMKNYGLNGDNKTAMLCALGIKPDGERKIIGFKLAFREDYGHWRELLLNLKSRGLLGKNLSLIIADDNAGLSAAAASIFPKVRVQTCVVHKMRNVIKNTSWKNKPALVEDLKHVYQAESKQEANARVDKFARRWYAAEEKAVRSLRFNFEKTLTYLDFPRQIWKKIRTTNILEREFREVRRRIKVFDNSFNGPESFNNYFDSIFSYLNEHYPANHLHTKS